MTETVDPYLAQRKDEILAAARTVFIRNGFERATMQEIADEVGLSAGAIYRYFPSKAALITSVCAVVGAGHLSKFNQGTEDQSALELLVSGGKAVWSALFGPEGDDALRINLEATVAAIRHPGEISEHLASEMTAEVRLLAGLIERAQDDGALPSDLEPQTLAALLLAVTQGMHLLNGQLRGDADVEGVWELLQRMIEQLGRSSPETKQG